MYIISRSYKITPRSQNAHAYVNAAFLFDIDPITFISQSTPRIVYGGISGDFDHATEAEAALGAGVLLSDADVQQVNLASMLYLIVRSNLGTAQVQRTISPIHQ